VCASICALLGAIARRMRRSSIKNENRLLTALFALIFHKTLGDRALFIKLQRGGFYKSTFEQIWTNLDKFGQNM
jgi:hypothetical protein